MIARFEKCLKCNHEYWWHSKYQNHCTVKNQYALCSCESFCKDNLDLIDYLAKERGLI